MSKQSPRPLGSVLSSVVDNLGLSRKINETRTIEAWAALAGPRLNAVTDSVWVDGRVLHVKVTSSTWRHELHLQRKNWVKELNRELGAPLVHDISFR